MVGNFIVAGGYFGLIPNDTHVIGRFRKAQEPATTVYRTVAQLEQSVASESGRCWSTAIFAEGVVCDFTG